MGIDLIRGGRIANRGFRATKSSNAYLKSLIKVKKHLCSSIPSLPEGLSLNSIRLYTRDSTNRDLPDIPSPSQESPDISPTIRLQSPKDRPSSTPRLSP
jgi:hypothetical protein